MRKEAKGAIGVWHRYSISRHIYFAFVLLLFALAAIFRFKLPQVLFIDPDVSGYLVPALSALADHGFQHVEGRSFVYPGFVYLILLAFHDFKAICIIQHLFGLATGGLLILCWNAAGSLIRKAPNLIYHLAGLGVATVFLFNTSVLRFEYFIRPEAIFPFFALLALFLNVQFIRFGVLEKAEQALRTPVTHGQRSLVIVLGVSTVVNAVLLFYLKPSFYLASLFATTPVWFFVLDKKTQFGGKSLILGPACVAAVLLFILPEHFLKSNDPNSKTFLPTVLFLIHADMIRDQLKQDIERKAVSAYSLEFLESTYRLLDQEISSSRKTGRYRSLGFDPDYMMFTDSFDRKFALSLGPDAVDRRVNFYYSYYFRVWSRQPFRMVRKIATQLSIVYNSVGKASPYKLEDHDSFGASYADNHELFEIKLGNPEIQSETLTAFRRDTDDLLKSRAVLHQPKFVTWANRFLARGFSICVLLTIVLLLVIMRDPIMRRKYGCYAMITLAFYGYSFFNSLGIAIIHSLEITRYLTSQIVYCLLPQSMTLFLLFELLETRIRNRKTN